MNDNNIWNTCIRLNLRSDEHIQKQIKQKFDHVDSKILLFLHRLKSLEINFENYYTKIFTRIDYPNRIIELSEYNGETEQKNYWLVIKRPLQIPDTFQVNRTYR